jgi:hypothetical protein
MSERIRILGPPDLERMPEPTEPTAANRSRYTRALVCEGAHRLIDNANVEVRALAVGDELWPLVLGNPGASNCDACSPLTWYVRYVPAETANRSGVLAATVSRVRGLPMEMLLRSGGIDRVVYVNNWLVATNPPCGLPAHAVADVTARLVSEWPDRAVVFRSINPAFDRSGFDALARAGYHLVRSRRVYLVDTREQSFGKHRNVRIDLAKLEKTSYQIMDDPARLSTHALRISELYRALYLTKHVHYNAQLNQRFFARTLSDETFQYRGLIREGRLDGFASFFCMPNMVGSLVLGYDVATDRKEGLYRLLIAILLREAAERGAVLNLSSGAGEFKALRGGRPADEFDAVYDAHLPAHRRLAWSALRRASNRHVIDRSLQFA